MCGRQGQQAAGTVAGGDKDRAGHRMCGAVGGWRGAAAGEARAAYDAICGAGRRWHAVRRPHVCAVAGNPDGWRDPKAGAGGPGGVDSERRCGRGGMVPGAGDVPEPGRQRVPWSRSGDRLLGKRLRPGTGSAAGAGRGNGIRTGCRNALARAAHGRDPRPCGYCM